jgi:hypothetical protein
MNMHWHTDMVLPVTDTTMYTWHLTPGTWHLAADS